MQFFGVVLLTLFSAVGYAIVHDLITVRVSLEYFTIGHPRIFETSSPTLLAIGWGVLASWWVALPFGFLLAGVAKNGRRDPPLSNRILLELIARLIVTMSLAALVSGITSYFLARLDVIELPRHLATAISEGRHQRYLAVWWAHGASYLVGLVGGVILIAVAWSKRRTAGASSRLPFQAKT